MSKWLIIAISAAVVVTIATVAIVFVYSDDNESDEEQQVKGQEMDNLEQQRVKYWSENSTEPCYEQSESFLYYIEYLEYYELAMQAVIDAEIFETSVLLREVLYPSASDKDQYADVEEYVRSQRDFNKPTQPLDVIWPLTVSGPCDLGNASLDDEKKSLHKRMSQQYWQVFSFKESVRAKVDRAGECDESFDAFMEFVSDWEADVEKSGLTLNETLEDLYFAQDKQTLNQTFQEFSQDQKKRYEAARARGEVAEMMFRIAFPQNVGSCAYETTQPLGSSIVSRSEAYLANVNFKNWLQEVNEGKQKQ